MIRFLSLCLCIIFVINLLSPAGAEDSSPLTYSLSLKQAIENALQNNKTIDNVKKSITAAELQHRALTKDRLPRVQTNYSYTRLINPMIIQQDMSSLLSFDRDGDGRIDTSLTEVETFEMAIPQDNYTWMNTLTMPIYTGGIQDYAETIASLGIDVARMRHLQARNELIKRVKYYYFTILRDGRQIEFLEQNLNSFTELERETIQYHIQGLVAKNAVLEANVQKAGALQELASARQSESMSWATLKTLMVMDLDKKMTLEDSPGREKIPYTLEECLAYAKAHNPEIVAFIFLKQQAAKAIRLERAYYNPTVNFSAYYFMYGETPGMEPTDWFPNSTLMAMLSINWLVTDWGKKRDEAAVKKVELEQIINNEKLALDALVLKIREAWSQMEVASGNVEVAELAITQARENVRIARLRFTEQEATSREVIDAITDLKRAEYNFNNSLYQYNVAIAELYQAMGVDTETAMSRGDEETREHRRLIEKGLKNLRLKRDSE